MGKPHRRFDKEFEAEAVRLVEMSGRTQREIAEDLGIGLSTLRRWLNKRRERDLESPPPERQEDLAVELKRLRRENEILRQEREILKRAATFFRQGGKSMRLEHIDAAKKEFPVQRLCNVLGVSPSGYFDWKRRPACRRQRDDMVLLAHVRSAFALSNETYGSPRMVHELRDNGLSTGRRRIARLMRENALKVRQKRRFKRTTDSLHAFPVAPNLLDQDFTATGPNQKWGADISYVWTCEGWLYLAVIDLFARRVVGWATSEHLHKELALSALRRATAIRHPPVGLIHHADRGSQYCSSEYQAELRRQGMLISMSGKGNCFDNAMVETFFKTLKAELVWRVAFQSRAEATHAIARYIDGFYNPVRRHSALDFISPLQFERLAA